MVTISGPNVPNAGMIFYGLFIMASIQNRSEPTILFQTGERAVVSFWSLGLAVRPTSAWLQVYCTGLNYSRLGNQLCHVLA